MVRSMHVIDICPFATVPPRMLCHGIPCCVVLASRVSLFVVGHPQHVQMFMLRVIGVVLGVLRVLCSMLGVLAALALHARRAGSGGAYPIRDRESSMVRERPNGIFSTEDFLQYSVSLSAISITSFES